MTLLATNAQISAPRARSRALTRFLSNRGAVAGACVIALILAMAILAPLITRYDPNTTNFLAIRKPPGLAYWLGTDELGRDLFARMLYGARASLMAGVISVSIAIAIGLPIGLIAGYYGGLVDMVISRCTEALLACPFLILAIALAAFLGPSLANAMVAIGLAAMPIFVRLTRGQVISVKAEDYVEGARAIGLPHHVILIRHVLPNVIAPVIVQATLATASAIIAEASLSFLGLGQQPPSPFWGSMLNTAKNFIEQAPWMSLWPGLAIFVVVLAFNLMGDGLRDALDPRRS